MATKYVPTTLSGEPSASKINANLQDIKDELNQKLDRRALSDNELNDDLDMNGFKVQNMKDGTDPQDAVTKKQLIAAIGASNLTDLLDVDTTGKSDGDVLTYDSAADEWQAQAPAGGSGTDVALDLGDTGTNDSDALTEIATTGDTNNIVTEPTADKALFDMSQNWPTADTAALANSLSGGALDDIAEIDSALRTGADTTLVTGTEGVIGNLSEWNTDGDLVDSGVASADVFTQNSDVDHDQTTNFVANEHIDHSSVNITAGTGLSGGGDITASRTLNWDGVDVEDSGTTVISATGINFGTDLDVVNDGDGTVTVNASGTGTDTRTNVSEGGVQVVADVTDINFNNNLNVTDDGDGSVTVDATGGGGSAIILDLGDDGSNESTDLSEIATTNDTNSVFTEPSADKLLIDLSQNWPTADTANNLSAGALDAIGEIDAALRTGADGFLVTGTSGVDGNFLSWNVDGDAVDSGNNASDFASASHTHTLADITDSGDAAAKGVTGLDANAVTGTSGTSGNLIEWNADGDAVDSGVTTADVVTTKPYDVGSFFGGTPASDELVLRHIAARAVDYASGLSPSQGHAETAPSAQTDFDIQKNGVSVGTMSFAASSNTATFSTSGGAFSLAAGDRLSVIAPSTLNSISNLTMTIAGTRA